LLIKYGVLLSRSIFFWGFFFFFEFGFKENLMMPIYFFRSVEPHAIEPKLPKDVSVGDTILSPLVIMNHSSSDLTDVTSEAFVCGASGTLLLLTLLTCDLIIAFVENNISVASNSRTRRLLTIPIGPKYDIE
jgi:hypothetical protein